MKLRVKEIIKEKGILFKDLATKVGVTDIALRASINGNPTIGTLEKIALALEVPVSDLFEQSENDTVNCPNCGERIKIVKG